MEASGRLVDITGFTVGMLWDDIGIVAREEYRVHLYERRGYKREEKRSMSPEIGNWCASSISVFEHFNLICFNLQFR